MKVDIRSLRKMCFGFRDLPSAIRNLLLQQLMSEDEEGSSKTRSEEDDEIGGELVSVADGEGQVLKEENEI